MFNGLRYRFLLVIAASLSMSCPLTAQDGPQGNLVTTSWLHKNLKKANLVILDASPSKIYTAKHIPGALNYDIFTYGVEEMPIAKVEALYQSWGISPGKKIVIYDQGGTFFATRLYFSLDYYGVTTKNLFILDGGLSKWQEAGLPVVSDPTPPPKKGSFTAGKLRKNVRVDLPEFLNASGDTRDNVLLEALDASWHFGGNHFLCRSGHIPNAVMLPATDFFNPDKTFKSAQEIRKMLTYFGIRPEQQVLTHCGGGIAASVPFFALSSLLNYPKVKLYPGSLLEWVSDQRELPVWTYDAPFLMRKASWLQSWGGKMMRMYGQSHISIVDVRTPDAFNEGHLPFAINIPSDILKKNISNPEELAGMLGPAGVNGSNEAVVVSGEGLTKESALAFVLLEKLGQKKVSVFMDPLNEGAKYGFAVTKDTTRIGPRSTPYDLSIPPTNYPRNFREGVMIVKPENTQGLYPTVFIASGNASPAKAPDGRVVHVPYTELLNADGTPKAANDVWNILTKAGVPRYAELVCFSDDPGESAANYFILRLMGYPDIKVLVI